MTARAAVRAGQRSGVCWWNVYADRERWEGHGESARTLVRWVDEHLMRPHRELGRTGPVCPFVRNSVVRRVFWAGLAAGGDGLTVEQMQQVVDDAVAIYRRLRADSPSEARVSTLITVFPELTRYDLIDAVHLSRKSEVVAEGLMLGQFYPGCAVPGLWNRDFRPLDAPVPMLVLRSMMSTDFPFLAARTEWLYAYFTQVAPNLPRNLRWAIAERMRVDGSAAAEITALRVHSAGEHAR
ncbi:DUF6875 domain-containing protein [Nocardia transvalensis]|uniref:DUF6875 domain-containing protein n=1 Tax=Nocardia transvalensis TaxID=37333 RepID=UPI001893726B|nr:hypothetical protein [Nocardia transvalensis]MBF6327106.1 hypothetical protein [Nocardia transvalensis]